MRRLLIPWLMVSVLSGTALVTATQQPPSGQLPVGRGRAGEPPEPRTGTAAIIGRVVEADSKSAVAGAIVTVSGAGASPQRVQVDAEGRFVFRGLPGGDFQVMAAKAGYVGGLAGQRLSNGPARPVQLTDGERLADLTLRLWKGGAIGGAVLDEMGEPVVGIKVFLAERRLLNGKRQITRGPHSEAVTDDRGLYRFGTVAPGEYLVVTRTTEEEIARGIMSLVMGDPSVIVPFAMKASGGRPEDFIAFENALRVYPPTFYPSALTPSGASPIAIRSGEVKLGVDLRIKLVQLARLAGNYSGLPTPTQGNPHVRLVLADPEAGDLEIATAIPSTGEKFTFLAVPAGKYLLQAYFMPRMSPVLPGPGGTPAGRGRGGPPPLPTEPSYWATMPVTVGGGEPGDITLEMRPGATIAGRVEFDGAAAPPVGPELERILVSPIPDPATALSMNPRGKVEADGVFRTSSLAPGKYRLRVGPVGSWQPSSAMFEGRDLLDEAVDLATSDITGVVVTFSDKRQGSVNGTVRTSEGTPDPAALVAIFPADPRLRTDFSGGARRMRLARTTRAGQYAIPGLPPGQYLIVAGGDELFDTWLEPTALAALARRAVRIDVAESGAQTQDLKNGAGR